MGFPKQTCRQISNRFVSTGKIRSHAGDFSRKPGLAPRVVVLVESTVNVVNKPAAENERECLFVTTTVDYDARPVLPNLIDWV